MALGKLQVTAHYTIENHPKMDILLIPGGYGSRAQLLNQPILDWIETEARGGRAPLVGLHRGAAVGQAWAFGRAGLHHPFYGA